MGESVRLKPGEATPAYRTGLVAVLDIGTSKTACLIGRGEPSNLRVLGAALRESQGIKAGAVIDMARAEESIRDTVAAAENHADARLQSVIVSVSCGNPQSVTARAGMALEGAIVTDEHLNALLKEGHERCRLDGLENIQCFPTGYAVDDARGVKNPIGMFSERIGVAMHAVAVRPPPLQNLKLAVARSHLTIAATLFSAHASALSVLSEDEKQLGATLIDMGGGTTSVAVFNEGHLVHASLVPMGGQHVTADLARMLSAPWSAAERAKTLFGAALGDLESGADVVAIAQTGEDSDEAAVRVPRSMLTRIIQARLEEIFGKVQEQLKDSGFDVAAGRRAVLTGGASQLAGMRELAGRVLNKQVRLGRPMTLAGLPAASSGPDYATAVGLLLAGATMEPEVLNPELARTRDRNGRTLMKRLTGGLFG
jgi:cell division protein FtsA